MHSYGIFYIIYSIHPSNCSAPTICNTEDIQFNNVQIFHIFFSPVFHLIHFGQCQLII